MDNYWGVSIIVWIGFLGDFGLGGFIGIDFLSGLLVGGAFFYFFYFDFFWWKDSLRYFKSIVSIYNFIY